jgi:N-methylhydantoinase B
VDRIAFEVIRSGLYAAAREMKIAMMRTAASPIIHSGGDASAAIFGPDAELVAQGNDIPAMLGSSVISTRVAIDTIGAENLRPGDVIISNDPYLGGGNHLNDVQLTRPVFFEGRIIAYTMTRGHWNDIGGSQPSSSSIVTWDIFGEGLRIPPLLLYRDDKLVPDLATIIFQNTREPDDRLLDLQAQYAGVFVGERRIVEYAKKFGADVLIAAMREALNHSERLMRDQIRRIPDGRYTGEDVVEVISEGYTRAEPAPIKVAITVEDDTITFDYTGSGPQVRGGVNCPLSVTLNSTWYTVKSVTDHSIPINQGCYRPIKVIAPEGTIVNAKYPASVVGANTSTSSRVVDMLLKALAPAIPGRVIAQSHATHGTAMFGGDDPDRARCAALGRTYVTGGDLNPGGFGARPDKDGINVIRCHVGNTGTQSVEYMEYASPLAVEEWTIVPDSGGAGRWRGGCTATRTFRVGYEEATLVLSGERGLIAPEGLFGGLSGALFSCRLERSDGTVEDIPPRGEPRVVHKGDLVIIQAAGAGGYGEPRDRDRHRVLEDLENGYITETAARELYGIEVAPAARPDRPGVAARAGQSAAPAVGTSKTASSRSGLRSRSLPETERA